MIRRGRKNHPRMLANVLKAIADMKDNRGSSIRKIVDQVATNNVINKNGTKPRNVTMQVRRALRHGINTGLLVQHAGKYRLGLDERDNYPVKEVRRRRKKGGGGKRGRGKRRGRATRRRKVRRRRSSRASSRSISDSEASPVSEETSYTSMDSVEVGKRPSRKSKRSAPKNLPDRSSSRKKKRLEDDTKGKYNAANNF